jgi:post-segregation antitoxin (ccd killing protein)
MPKMQVYLPEDLYEQVKAAGTRLNVSGVLQEALGRHLAQLARLDALGAALDQHTTERGEFTEEELAKQADADQASIVYPRPRKNRSSAA